MVSWDNHINNKYGKPGTACRDNYEEAFESFKIGVLIQEARKKRHMTQEELAIRSSTTKKYTSRIENNASDI